ERPGPPADAGGQPPADPGAQPGGRQAGGGRRARARGGSLLEHALGEEGDGVAAPLHDGFVPAPAAADEDTDQVPAVAAPAPSTNGSNGLVPDTPVALSCDKVEVSYGPVQILFGVDLEVHEGEIAALLGTNGAGKSTLLKGASGLVKVGGGSVRLGDLAVDGQQAESIARKGLSLMPGGRGIFPTLTVDENLRLGTWMVRKDHRAVSEAKERVLHLFPILRQRAHQQAGNLS